MFFRSFLIVLVFIKCLFYFLGGIVVGIISFWYKIFRIVLFDRFLVNFGDKE